MIQSMNTLVHGDVAHQHGFFGNDICIAYLDTGISYHKDFQPHWKRIVEFVDFVNKKSDCYDDNGHGTHITGIAASACPLGNDFLGIAPLSKIVSLKVLDAQGKGNASSFVKGLQWIHENHKSYHIRIVNISIGSPSTTSKSESRTLISHVNQLWDDGLIVCIAGGNHGPKAQTISVPGNSHKVITVGASDDSYRIFGRGSLSTNYSGRGPTSSCIMKPDVVAPGTNVLSCIPKNRYAAKSGTSMSTPVVSAAIALLLDKYPYYTNKQAKMKLKNNCDPLNTSKYHQGWGQINIQKLLDL